MEETTTATKKKFIIAVYPKLSNHRIGYHIKNWDGKSKVYFRGHGFTTNVLNGKCYQSKTAIKDAVLTIRFLYRWVEDIRFIPVNVVETVKKEIIEEELETV